MARELSQEDPDLFILLQAEERRQERVLNLIASENFAPKLIREIGSHALTNKYTEGYPGNRYYAGCRVFDQIEDLAIDRAKSLFGAAWANVQPHSGASANNAVFQALLKPGDKILGLKLSSGGHLTHGLKANVSGAFYTPSFYHLKGTKIDMDEVEEVALREKPKLIIAGWSAYTDTMDFARFREIADASGALLMVDMSHFSGLVAGRAYPSPLPFADIVTSTTHKTLRGPRGGFILGNNFDLKKQIDRAVFPGQQGGALPQTIAAKALAFHLASRPSWKEYARQTIKNAAALADSLEAEGLQVISARKTHQLLIDLKGASAAEAERLLEKNNIICNRNTVPGGSGTPKDPSGLRMGSPALTTRGFKEEEFREVGQLISLALSGQDTREAVRRLTDSFKDDTSS